MKGLTTILRSLGSLIVSVGARKETVATGLLLIAVAAGASLFNLSGNWATSTLECLKGNLSDTSLDTSTKDLHDRTISGSKEGIPNFPE